MRFEDLKIREELRKKAEDAGFEELTEIQESTINHILEGKDVVGQAETGSGKTLAFALPALDKISPGKGLQVLVLTPTRELCVQVADVFSDFGRPIGATTATVYGGVAIEPQMEKIKIADVVVGTPGRVLDHISRDTIHFDKVKFMILDETDRMLDMGFIDDVEEIISKTPKDRQTLMFSATIQWEVEDIMNKHLRDPVMVRTQSYVDTKKLRQYYYDIYYPRDKFPLLVHLLKNETPGLSLVFCATREEAGIVAANLRKQGVDAMEIHGGMTQNKREKSLDSLKKEETDVLVATDVAARGLDIKNVTHVYNYDAPNTPKEYIHRIGRTARAGEAGTAVTLLAPRDHDNFRRILQDDGIEIPREEIPYFKKVPFFRDLLGENDFPRRRGGFGGRGRPGGGFRGSRGPRPGSGRSGGFRGHRSGRRGNRN